MMMLDFKSGVRDGINKRTGSHAAGREHRTHVRGAFSRWKRERVSGVLQGNCWPNTIPDQLDDLSNEIEKFMNMFAADAKNMEEVWNKRECEMLQRNLKNCGSGQPNGY